MVIVNGDLIQLQIHLESDKRSIRVTGCNNQSRKKIWYT